jgi:hypothetical protein
MSDSDRQRLLDRILKILALAEGTSFEGEAATARAMAAELIAKHNVSLPAEGKTPRDEIIINYYKPWGTKWLWERIIASAIAHLCACAMFYSGDPDEGGYDHFTFVGQGMHVEACLYVLGQVHIQRQRAWVRYRGEGGNDSFGKFCFSFARGLEGKIDQLLSSAQLDEAERARLWYRERHNVEDGTYITGAGSSDAGHHAGAGASLHRGEAPGPRSTLRIGH